MVLAEHQADTLTELINIAYARAAGALSQITGYRIALEVPDVALHPVHEIAPILTSTAAGEITAVNQVFSGDLCGQALLIMNAEFASVLVDLLTDGTSEFDPWIDERREAITEVGNIMLSACLGVFGNLLEVNVAFSVPLLHIADVHAILQSTTVGRDNLSHGLIIRTHFHVRDHDFSGSLVIILGVTSLNRLLQGLHGWESRSIEQ